MRELERIKGKEIGYTRGIWKVCKKPKRKPNKVTFNKRGQISSRYWYGVNSKGKYTIRESDHWGWVGTCHWGRTTDFKKNDKKICCKVYNNKI